MKKKNKTKKDNKHFLIFSMFYFLLILTISVLTDKSVNNVYSLFFVAPLIFIMYLLISKILTWKWEIKRPIIIWGNGKYDLIVNWKHNPFKERLPRKKEKLKIDKIILYILFIVIPFTFVPFLVQGTWQNSIEFKSGSGTFLQDRGLNEIKEGGTISINPQIDLNLMQQISYITGRELNLQIMDICFINNGTQPSQVINKTFKSTVTIDNNVKLSVPYSGKKCFPFDYFKKSISYEWITSFEYPVKWRQGIPDYSSSPMNYKRVRINYSNLGIIFIILLISWWAFCLLVIRVFLYLYKGLELK